MGSGSSKPNSRSSSAKDTTVNNNDLKPTQNGGIHSHSAPPKVETEKNSEKEAQIQNRTPEKMQMIHDNWDSDSDSELTTEKKKSGHFNDEVNDLEQELDSAIRGDHIKNKRNSINSANRTEQMEHRTPSYVSQNSRKHSDLSQEGGDLNMDRNGVKSANAQPTPSEEYPETYAQRMARIQKEQEQVTGLGREKTQISRNPEEWNIDTQPEQIDGFDPQKFKAVNKVTNKENEPISNDENQNMFSEPPAESEEKDNSVENTQSPDQRAPKYDITEEELMADIEQML